MRVRTIYKTLKFLEEKVQIAQFQAKNASTQAARLSLKVEHWPNRSSPRHPNSRPLPVSSTHAPSRPPDRASICASALAGFSWPGLAAPGLAINPGPAIKAVARPEIAVLLSIGAADRVFRHLAIRNSRSCLALATNSCCTAQYEWEERNEAYQRGFETMSGHVPAFRDAYADALSDIRRLALARSGT